MTTTNDTSDLEALFDSIAADYTQVAPVVAPAVKPAPVVAKAPPASDHNDD